MAHRIPKDWVDAYFEYGVDYANRRIFLGDITTESAEAVVKGLYLMEGGAESKPIELFLNSPGGDTEEMFAIYDIIQTIKCPVHTFAYGKCMSAAPLLLACGEKGERWISRHCSLMLHDAFGRVEGTQQHSKAEIKYWDKRLDMWWRLLAANSDKPFSFWKSVCNKPHDYYFGVDEALEWGLADKIWEEK